MLAFGGEVVEDVLGNFVELFGDRRGTALGKFRQLYDLYAVNADIGGNIVAPFFSHLEGGCEIYIVRGTRPYSIDEIAKTQPVHSSRRRRASLYSVQHDQALVASQPGNNVHSRRGGLDYVSMVNASREAVSYFVGDPIIGEDWIAEGENERFHFLLRALYGFNQFFSAVEDFNFHRHLSR